MTTPGHKERQWRVIVSHPDYEISDAGDIRCGRRRRYLKPGDAVRLNKTPHGYVIAHLDGKSCSVHRLVCLAFHGCPPSPLHEVAHNNGVREDNRAENLRWATRKENLADIKKHGTMNPPRGEKQGRSVLMASDVAKIRSLSGQKMQREIAAEFGVARTTVSAILNGYNWRHL